MSLPLKDYNDTYNYLDQPLDHLYQIINQYYCVDEGDYIRELQKLTNISERTKVSIQQLATHLITHVRSHDSKGFIAIDALLQEYSLSDTDGVVLMCLAEALLRIPDKNTADALIKDKLSGSEWARHLNKDNTFFVNASTWGLIVAGHLVEVGESSVSKWLNTATTPIIRMAVEKAMRIMGEHFVLGRNIDEAMANAQPMLTKGYSYSYDMLGESAITQKDAHIYCNSYLYAIKKMGAAAQGNTQRPTLSIKLSALHPRFEESQRKRVLHELSETLVTLLNEAKAYDVGITIDAEEADRLELTLTLFKKVLSRPEFSTWKKFGLVVQAYSKRALPVLQWLAKLACDHKTTIPVRLVKGAYWDSEIQHSQVLGLDDYPVFTHKSHTDISYLACAQFLLSAPVQGLLFPQFATHNAYTVASILTLTQHHQGFEFQRLHGMGDELYDAILTLYDTIDVRIYAPVGSHENLLPYLVRRLLENGANSSFVHQIADKNVDIQRLTQHPKHHIDKCTKKVSTAVHLPESLFKDRQNSQGVNLSVTLERLPFMQKLEPFIKTQWIAMPIINGNKVETTNTRQIVSPYNNELTVGWVYDGDAELATKAITIANDTFAHWKGTSVHQRAKYLHNLADLIEKNRDELIALCLREAGKTLQDAIDEIREAVDFCRYYAQQANKHLSLPTQLLGPTGESNQLGLEGRGVFVCISPWNFPLAIFVGQIAAALVTGNTVVAKPAEATSLIAYRAIELFLQAGFPASVLHYLPGIGHELGSTLNSDERVAGVAFTGSSTTAKAINRTLANREGSIATLIAETGGLNAMIVDSTALPEQVAQDVVKSAFSSAGQRCSALRILYVQEDIADRVIDLIQGTMSELVVGDPNLLKTDIGPIIDANAQGKLLHYIDEMKAKAYHCFQLALPKACHNGNFVPPTFLEIQSINDMHEEQFGPILHIARFKGQHLQQVIQDINDKGYGLTLGIHSRNASTYEMIAAQAHIGNIYVNRNQIGAVVGVNPFGGCGLSGTGPKAGGPHYLLSFTTEKTITINTSAIGGNVDLLNQTHP